MTVTATTVTALDRQYDEFLNKAEAFTLTAERSFSALAHLSNNLGMYLMYAGARRDDTVFAALIKGALFDGFAIGREALGEGYYGYSTREASSLGKKIVLNTELNGVAEMRTFVHERAHTLLHFDLTTPEYEMLKVAYETQAEAVAYLVLQHFGYDVTQSSGRYVAQYSAGVRGSFELYRDEEFRQEIIETALKIIADAEKQMGLI